MIIDHLINAHHTRESVVQIRCIKQIRDTLASSSLLYVMCNVHNICENKLCAYRNANDCFQRLHGDLRLSEPLALCIQCGAHFLPTQYKPQYCKCKLYSIYAMVANAVISGGA